MAARTCVLKEQTGNTHTQNLVRSWKASSHETIFIVYYWLRYFMAILFSLRSPSSSSSSSPPPSNATSYVSTVAPWDFPIAYFSGGGANPHGRLAAVLSL